MFEKIISETTVSYSSFTYLMQSDINLVEYGPMQSKIGHKSKDPSVIAHTV